MRTDWIMYLLIVIFALGVFSNTLGFVSGSNVFLKDVDCHGNKLYGVTSDYRTGDGAYHEYKIGDSRTELPPKSCSIVPNSFVVVGGDNAGYPINVGKCEVKEVGDKIVIAFDVSDDLRYSEVRGLKGEFYAYYTGTGYDVGCSGSADSPLPSSVSATMGLSWWDRLVLWFTNLFDSLKR